MNYVLTEQPNAILVKPESQAALKCESQLRVAATMLRRARPSEMTATTVVGVLGLDDCAAFNALVAEIGNQLDLDARVRLNVGSYSVRFSRRADYGGFGFNSKCDSFLN
jgi:hypothetical protein